MDQPPKQSREGSAGERSPGPRRAARGPEELRPGISSLRRMIRELTGVLGTSSGRRTPRARIAPSAASSERVARTRLIGRIGGRTAFDVGGVARVSGPPSGAITAASFVREIHADRIVPATRASPFGEFSGPAALRSDETSNDLAASPPRNLAMLAWQLDANQSRPATRDLRGGRLPDARGAAGPGGTTSIFRVPRLDEDLNGGAAGHAGAHHTWTADARPSADEGGLRRDPSGDILYANHAKAHGAAGGLLPVRAPPSPSCGGRPTAGSPSGSTQSPARNQAWTTFTLTRAGAGGTSACP